MTLSYKDWEDAFHTQDVNKFVEIMTPKEWVNLVPVFKSLNLKFEKDCGWIPGLTNIPLTTRGSDADFPNKVIRSVMFRYHDVLHNLWGQPTEKSTYVDVQIAGEFVVLVLSECWHGKLMYESSCAEVKEILECKEAIKLHDSFLVGKTKKQTALELESIFFHGAEFTTTCKYTNKFINYFRPMLLQDFENSTSNLKLFEELGLKEECITKYKKDENMICQMMDNFESLVKGEGDLLYTPIKHKLRKLPKGWK